MPRLSNTHVGNIGFIWTIDSGVGPDRANKRADVMLVQMLLKLCGTTTLSGGLPGLHQRNLKPDGHFGPITAQFISGFESGGVSLESRRHGRMLVNPDGGFDPLSGKFRVQSEFGLLFKIVAANIIADETHPDIYRQLNSHEDTPPILRRALGNPANRPGFPD